MSTLTAVLNEEIRRLARKEIREQVGATIKQTAQQRREIAELKRQNTDLQRRVAYLEKQEKKRLANPASATANGNTDGEAPVARFSAKWLSSHRAKLGFSAADYAALVGCSPLSIYKWEKEENEPRAAQREALARIRGLGKREALKQLELLEG